MEGITITLTPEKAEDFFHSALCNESGMVRSAGGEIDYSEKDYKAAKRSLQAKTPNEKLCIEDVLVEILRNGKKLTWIDHENEGEYTRHITLKEVHERVAQMPIEHLVDYINEHDDADTAFILLQQVFLDEQAFG